MLSNNKYENEITQEIRENFELYLSKKWVYFGVTIYYDENLNILYSALSNYALLLSKIYFSHKKDLLSYKEELI